VADKLADNISFARGPDWRNRFALAPLTNLQSNEDGTLGDDEYNFLVRRGEGGFGLVMTCAAHVSKQGQAFPGQLGTFADEQIDGLTRLAAGIKSTGAIASAQLQHAGQRAKPELSGTDVVAPWDIPKRGVRAMTTAEVEQMVQDFIDAAVRCEKAGFDGVELHGAHGYVLCAFMSKDRNNRTDQYGGSYENRTRVYHEIIEGIRKATGPQFQLGLRFSPEKYGYPFEEALRFATEMLQDQRLDYLDMSLWDSFKEPDEEEYHGKRLVDWFSALPRKNVRLGIAGKLFSAHDAKQCMDAGADFVFIGRGAILHPDFPKLATADANFVSDQFPVTCAHLNALAVGPAFVEYLATGWTNYVSDWQES